MDKLSQISITQQQIEEQLLRLSKYCREKRDYSLIEALNWAGECAFWAAGNAAISSKYIPGWTNATKWYYESVEWSRRSGELANAIIDNPEVSQEDDLFAVQTRVFIQGNRALNERSIEGMFISKCVISILAQERWQVTAIPEHNPAFPCSLAWRASFDASTFIDSSLKSSLLQDGYENKPFSSSIDAILDLTNRLDYYTLDLSDNTDGFKQAFSSSEEDTELTQ
jgi:hypothetical protein